MPARLGSPRLVSGEREETGARRQYAIAARLHRNGFWLLLKRLEQDRFSWPREAAVATLTVEQLHWLLDGIDIAVVRRHPRREYLRAS